MKIAVGYFSATPPIAGGRAAADLFQINAGIDKNLTNNIVVLTAELVKQVYQAVVVLQQQPHENMMVNDRDDLASSKALVNQSYPG